jgi:oxygen-dependent protoporphyrinogen oxidase
VLITEAIREIHRIMQPVAEPVSSAVTRWRRALPQYEVGHLDRIARIEAATAGLPMIFAGTSYRGVGIPDCVRQGQAAARLLI